LGRPSAFFGSGTGSSDNMLKMERFMLTFSIDLLSALPKNIRKTLKNKRRNAEIFVFSP